MDTHTYTVLEFDTIRAFLENQAQSAGGKRLCRQIQPLTQPADVLRLQNETTEMRTEIEDAGPLALSDVHDIAQDVERTRIQNFHLDQQQLLDIKSTLETAGTVKAFFDGLQEKAPALFQQTEPLIHLNDLINSIRRCISDHGDILDSASKLLAELRRQTRSLRKQIVSCLEKHLHDVDLSFALQDDFITLRNNRFVIPVRSDRKSSIKGVVHDQSQSKSTLFIEPLEILELNNSLQLVQREISQEEIRILTELSQSVQQHESTIINNLTILEYIDVIHARSLLSKALNACSPSLNTSADISLKKCRHPILSARFLEAEHHKTLDTEDEPPAGWWVFDKSGVVEIDIVKQAHISTLVITGANAGGKTVALKTLGLFALMYQSGLHLPVAPKGHITLFDNLFADIGDEQNIEAHLSTFSAHMHRLKTVANNATARSLVLLDELGSGTDPSEGGALAMALLDHLRSLGCTTLVTSHLTLLKTYAHSHTDVDNVSVEFDPQTHRPLYRLVYGLPGFSNALSIAKNIGLPESILKAAAAYTGSSDQKTVDLVQILEDSQRELQKKNDAIERISQQTSLIRNTCQRLLDTMQKRKDTFLKQFETSTRTLLRESENRLRSIIKQQRRQLRQDPQVHSENDGLKQMHQIKQTLYSYFPPKSPSQKPIDDAVPGQRVTIISLKKTGTVTAVDTLARRAEIDIGSMRVKAGFHELALPGGTKQIPKPQLPIIQQTHSSFEKQINVIGMRVAEALPLIDKSIDNAILQGADMLEIIHGRGTGRLMRAIHSHIKDHDQVAALVPDHDQPGNSGVTRIELK